MRNFSNQAVHSYIADLASKQSSPGGGTAAAVTVSQGAALLCMVLGFTVGRKKYRVHDETLGPIQVSCEKRWQKALELAERDASAFAGVMACYSLPKGTCSERDSRRIQLESALYVAADVPHELLKICLSLLRESKLVGELGNRTILSDVVVAVHHLKAAAFCCETNIRINLNSVAHSKRRSEMLDSVRALIQAMKSASAAALEVCQIRLELPE